MQLVILGHETSKSSLDVDALGFGLGVTDHTGVALAEGATPTKTDPTRPTDTTRGNHARGCRFVVTAQV